MVRALLNLYETLQAANCPQHAMISLIAGRRNMRIVRVEGELDLALVCYRYDAVEKIGNALPRLLRRYIAGSVNGVLG
jgi:hypothetical protein